VALGPGLKMPAAGPAHQTHYSFQPRVSAVGLIVAGAVAVGAWTEGSGTVRVQDGQALTTDGPFADTKEVFAGH
jgi:hypothetical protein